MADSPLHSGAILRAISLIPFCSWPKALTLLPLVRRTFARKMAENYDEAEEDTMRPWVFESYQLQARTIWPGRGQHILAQYNDASVVVYQAYNATIATYAVEHQKFAGCPAFNESRMTWIKPNFLWMMFRSGWGSKPNQTNVLAISLKRHSFDRYLELARRNGGRLDGAVRLQWDPDHFPLGTKHPYRRALQLGLKGIASYANGEDILSIRDISEFVQDQGRLVALVKSRKNKDAIDDLLVARERVYVPDSEAARLAVDIDDYNEDSTSQGHHYDRSSRCSLAIRRS